MYCFARKFALLLLGFDPETFVSVIFCFIGFSLPALHIFEVVVLAFWFVALMGNFSENYTSFPRRNQRREDVMRLPVLHPGDRHVRRCLLAIFAAFEVERRRRSHRVGHPARGGARDAARRFPVSVFPEMDAAMGRHFNVFTQFGARRFAALSIAYS